MFKIKSTCRLAITLGLGCASLVYCAIGVGIIPNSEQMRIENRISLSKAMAVNVATLAEGRRIRDLKVMLTRSVEAEPTLASVGILRKDKRSYHLQTENHELTWDPEVRKNSSRQIEVDIIANGRVWGVLQIVFQPTIAAGLFSWLVFPVGLVLFVSATMTLMSWAVLAKTFRYLNPSAVVPGRVKTALDTLSEGLVLISPQGEIALANLAFEKIVGQSESEILGGKLERFRWSTLDNQAASVFPWDRCQTEMERVCGEIVELLVDDGQPRKFVVNATPIKSGNESIRGALVSFDDVTEIESKNVELGEMIHTLRSSHEEVERQNVQLSFLASYDPLTKCMNRRAFFAEFEQEWGNEDSTELSVMILDVDHFKAVNDNHGHSVGDDVLRVLGSLLPEVVGDDGIVCRYGGEEFVVLVPALPIEEAIALGERIRCRIESNQETTVRFTASIGVSSRQFGAMDPQHLLDQADESLYVAKWNGRNRVVRFDERESYPNQQEVAEVAEAAEAAEVETCDIPYSAVTGLLSALSFHCHSTAEHSVRVADLCIALGKSLMGSRDLYRLEVAALLHDIGKIGVPDSILKKPGPLTPDEWEIMRKHDQIGVEIVRNAFGAEQIAGLIESHHLCFAARNQQEGVDENLLPLAGRIISVCDAFDSMTSHQIYRPAVSEFEALEEIVRNSPKQFDPEIVKLLVIYVQEGHHVRHTNDEVSFGKHGDAELHQVQELFDAAEVNDIERLRSVVNGMKRDDISPNRLSPNESLGHEPHEFNYRSIDSGDSSEVDLSQIASLSNEVQACCESNQVVVHPLDVAVDLSNKPTPLPPRK